MASALIGHQIGGGLLLFFVAALGALIPFLTRKRSLNSLTVLLNTMACGTFLGLAILHLFGEAMHDMEEAGIVIKLGDGHDHDHDHHHCHSGVIEPPMSEEGQKRFKYQCKKVGEKEFILPPVENEYRCVNGEITPKLNATEQEGGHKCVLHEGVEYILPPLTHEEHDHDHGHDDHHHHDDFNCAPLFMFLGFGLILAVDSVIPMPGGSDNFMVHAHEAAHGHDHGADSGAARMEAQPLEKKLTASTVDPLVAEHHGEDHAYTKKFSPAAMCTLLALSLHALFEGMIVGLQPGYVAVWTVAAAICGHKWAEGFALSCAFAEQKLATKWSILYLAVFCAIAPIGTFIGMGVGTSNKALSGICNSIATGTILYVASEMIFALFADEPPRDPVTGKVKKRDSKWAKFLCFVVGFLIMFALTILHVWVGH